MVLGKTGKKHGTSYLPYTAPGRSLDEWMKLVTECRQSGLTNTAWCNEVYGKPSNIYHIPTFLEECPMYVLFRFQL